MRNGGMDGVVREALAGQITSRLRRRSATSDDALRACRLALERSDGGLRDLLVDAGKVELVADALVPRPPVGEPGCS